METMIQQIKSLPISDATARLIACQRFTDEVYDSIMQALKEMYGEYAGEEIMEKKCLQLFNQIEAQINEFLAESIKSNIDSTDMKAI